MNDAPEDRGSHTAVMLTIAVLLSGLFAGSWYEVYVRSARAEQLGIELAEATQNARTGVDLVARELRAAAGGVTILVGSQYRLTFALDRNGNRRTGPGDVVTYFLDPGGDSLSTSQHPFAFVLRRAVGGAADAWAAPIPGRGEIVAYGLTQRSLDTVSSRDVPLFSYRDSSGQPLELKSESESDPAGVFFGKTVSPRDLGRPGSPSRVRSVHVRLVTETEQKNLETGRYDRVTTAASVPVSPTGAEAR